MFHHRTLILFLATVLGSLANQAFVTDRRRSYNSNTNNNQLFGGYDGGIGRNVGNDRDRGMIYAKPPTYDVIPKPGVVGGKDRGGLYVPPKYILRGNENNDLAAEDFATGGSDVGRLGAEAFGDLGAEGFRPGNLRDGTFMDGDLGTVYNAIDDSMGYEGGYGGEICDSSAKKNKVLRYDYDKENTMSEGPTDDDGSLESLFNNNNNYNVILKGRRILGRRLNAQGIRGSDSDVNSNADNKIVGQGLRSTDNWIPYRTAYITERKPTIVISVQPKNVVDRYVTDRQSTYMTDLQAGYVNDRQPNYVMDGQPNYVTERQPKYVTDRQPTYVADQQPNYVASRQPSYVTPRQPMYSNEIPAYPTTLQSDDDYDRDMNINSNVNYNLLNGRRNNNINSNSNNNDIRYDGYGQDRVYDGYGRIPSYSGYDPEGYDTDQPPRNYGDHEVRNRKQFRPIEHRTHPKFNVKKNDDDNHINDDYDDNFSQYEKANVNTNSNTNVIGRRSAIRNPRSVGKSLDKSDHLERLSNEEATKVSDAETTSPLGPETQKRKSSMLYQREI